MAKVGNMLEDVANATMTYGGRASFSRYMYEAGALLKYCSVGKES